MEGIFFMATSYVLSLLLSVIILGLLLTLWKTDNSADCHA